MKVNTKLLPIKSHYFFFMAAMGPILPQLSVYGRQLGVPPEIMGSVTGCLPILFLISKPVFGVIVDIFRKYRKAIFMGLIIIMATSYSLICAIPSRRLKHFDLQETEICGRGNSCNIVTDNPCQRRFVTCVDDKIKLHGEILINEADQIEQLCIFTYNDSTVCQQNHTFSCLEDYQINQSCLSTSWEFWYFIVLMSIGTVAFNIVNSISDAICFDVIGTEFDYGKQRVWGTIGFGCTALIAGYIVNLVAGNDISYVPAFIVMLFCIFFDIISCYKLKLPIIPKPENFFKDISTLLSNIKTVIFIVFATLAGVVDGIIVYFLFWYIEDLAQETGTQNIKLLEGIIVACETLGSEVIFFSLSGKIINRFGYAYTLSMGFMFYALRLSLISFVPNPWWIIPIELTMQGPTYALIYTTIVAYANDIAPPGMSATMQGIAAGVDDGLGYAIGSTLGGFLYKYVGDAPTLQIFATLALVCSITNFILHRSILSRHNNLNENIVYDSPNKASETVNSAE